MIVLTEMWDHVAHPYTHTGKTITQLYYLSTTCASNLEEFPYLTNAKPDRLMQSTHTCKIL